MEKTTTPNNKRLIDELIRGRDFTKKLQSLLHRRIVNDGSSSSTNDLVMKILGSFSNSLLELSSWGSDPVLGSGSVCSDDRTLDSTESEKKLMPRLQHRRGCYKRRKMEDSRIVIAETMEDGYSWRKYGQKEILNAKFPRCYFRCAHKGEGCKALKQVQKQEDESEMFHITYFGFHTCHHMHKNTQMFSNTGDLSCFLVFEDYKIKESPSSLSTNRNARIAASLEQEYDSNAKSDEYLASSNHRNSSIASWNDIIGNLAASHDAGFKNGKFDESVFLQV